MKRTWLVYIEAGCGHELNNTISESEFFGPYTQQEAEKLASRLNAIFQDSDEREPNEASAMPLQTLSPNQVVRHFGVVPQGES